MKILRPDNAGLLVQSPSVKQAREIAVTADTGLSLTNPTGASGNPTLAGVNASTSTKGVASFTSADFTASSGAISKRQISFAARPASNQTISNNTFTKANVDSTQFDTDSYFDTVNYRYVPLVAGKYFFAATAGIQSTGSLVLYMTLLYKNGSEVIRTQNYANVTGGTISTATYTTIDMNGTTDYVELYVYQNSGMDRTLFGGGSFTEIFGYRL